MKAIHLYEFGPAENLKVVDIPIPQPREGEVLITVDAASIIYPDTIMRRGDYIYPPSLPIVPGREVAGVISQVGPNVKSVKPGWRVSANLNVPGGYAEYAVAPVKDVICLPDRVSFLQSLVYHMYLRIAYVLYHTAGKIQPGEIVLLHSAAGGIGTLITQIAKKRGDNIVIALAGTDEKLEWCRANGADYLINYTKCNYVDEVLRITGGRGVDVSLNGVGGPTLETDPYAIRPLGRWVIFGFAGGKGRIDPYEEIFRRSLTTTVFTIYTVLEREEFRHATDFLMHWLHTEDLMPANRTFTFEGVVEAHRLLETKQGIGKFALVTG